MMHVTAVMTIMPGTSPTDLTGENILHAGMNTVHRPVVMAMIAMGLATRHRGDVNILHLHVTPHMTMTTTLEAVQQRAMMTAQVAIHATAIPLTGAGRPHPEYGVLSALLPPRHRDSQRDRTGQAAAPPPQAVGCGSTRPEHRGRGMGTDFRETIISCR